MSLSIRVIESKDIVNAVKKLCIEANKRLPSELTHCIKCSVESERNPLAQSILSDLVKNMDVALELDIPICQDTGMAVVFIKLGQDVHIVGQGLNDAINEGVRQGYTQGKLRCSIVSDPLGVGRVNTGDNTPAVIHTDIVSGDTISITVAPKGFGSENMSMIKMFEPSATIDEIEDFIVSVVNTAGSNPCPPIVVGVGIGGDFEMCAKLSKEALCGNLSLQHEIEGYNEMEQRILSKINKLNIGPQGFGGDTTALAVKIKTYPTHIAGLPVAVNIGCHVTRHKNIVL